MDLVFPALYFPSHVSASSLPPPRPWNIFSLYVCVFSSPINVPFIDTFCMLSHCAIECVFMLPVYLLSKCFFSHVFFSRYRINITSTHTLLQPVHIQTAPIVSHTHNSSYTTRLSRDIVDLHPSLC